MRQFPGLLGSQSSGWMWPSQTPFPSLPPFHAYSCFNPLFVKGFISATQLSCYVFTAESFSAEASAV